LRADRPPADAWFSRAGGGLLLIAGAGLGAAFLGAAGAAVGAAVGLAAAVALERSLGRRWVRRKAALAHPFPEAWRRFLLDRYDHYERLPQALRPRFEDDLRLFLAEKRITGVGIEASDELRLLVAASAVTLSLAWPAYEWDQLSEVLLYAQDFDRDYSFEQADLAGQAHPWGTVILSAPTLVQSFENPDDGYHVGLHEFAHLLDLQQTRFQGVPAGLPGARAAEWLALAQREMERLRKGKSVLDPYGAEDPVEFLAVAVEAFFEMPLLVRQRHREVYALLAEYFGQDPAAWDDSRGLAV